MSQVDPQIWAIVSEQFHALVDLELSAQQKALEALKKTCPEAIAPLQKLLQEEDALHPILQTDSTHPWEVAEDESLVGSEIGIYRLTKHVGSGGMGSVFLAERNTGDFDREVALKLIRPGALQEESIRRFRQERQILANLTHPGIARLYDGGNSKEGRLYFTMEHIEGQDILTYLKTRNAGLEERIQLFLEVARAMAYAHSSLVLHLDLKPSNILVKEGGEVKLLDFGVAERLQSNTVTFTTEVNSGSHRYTLAYGSPEQLEAQALSTRSDIYSMGVLLYELLSGKLPIAYEGLTPADYKTHIRQTEILPPSQCINFSVPQISPQKLKGDLDKIVMHCLAKNAENRYPTVEQLIEDLENYLYVRPISIRREDRFYTFSKFTIRNRAWLSTLGLALVGLLFLASYYTQALRKERNEAIAESQKNVELLNFVQDIFYEADPLYAQGDTLTVYDLIAQASDRIDSTFQDQPELYLEMVNSLGSIYLGLGEYALADTLLQKGFQVLAKQPEIQQSEIHGKMLYLKGDIEYGMGEYKQATETSEAALAIARRNGLEAASIAPYYLRLGDLALDQSDREQADSLYHLALTFYQKDADPPKTDLARINHSLGDLNRQYGNYDSSRLYLNRALRYKREVYQPPHVEIAYTLNHLASLYYDLGQYDSALTYAKESLRQRSKVFGENHVETVASMGNCARIFEGMSLPDSALRMRMRMKNSIESIFPGPHPYRLGIYSQLGSTYNRQGESEKAEAIFRKGVDMHAALVSQNGGDYAYPGSIMYNGLGLALYQQNRFQEALPVLRRAWQLSAKLNDPESVSVAYVEVNLGRVLAKLGQQGEARTMLLHAQQIFSPLPDKHALFLQKIAESLAEMRKAQP